MPELILSPNDVLSSYLRVYARWFVGGAFLVASVAKARNLEEFVSTVQLFRLVPGKLSKVVAHLIIALELIIGLCLLVGLGVRLAAIIATTLFSGFTLAILINLVRHNIFDCNCFGPYFKEKIGVKAVARNLLLLALCLWVLAFYDGYLALEFWLFGQMAMQDASLGPFLLLTAILILSGLCIAFTRTVLKSFKLVG